MLENINVFIENKFIMKLEYQQLNILICLPIEIKIKPLVKFLFQRTLLDVMQYQCHCNIVYGRAIIFFYVLADKFTSLFTEGQGMIQIWPLCSTCKAEVFDGIFFVLLIT